MEENLDQISPILPLDFFQAKIPLFSTKKMKSLPDFSELLFEDSFAKVSAGWENKGLTFEVLVKEPFEASFFPEYRKGDSIELFIDTRDLKSAGFLTKFCHHFVILPQPVEDIHAAEVTAFRTEDRHELCDPEKIQVKPTLKKTGYSVHIFLPAECLEGYDPKSFDRLGFSYRINQGGSNPQHFTLSSDYWAIETQPSLWCSMELQ